MLKSSLSLDNLFHTGIHKLLITYACLLRFLYLAVCISTMLQFVRLAVRQLGFGVCGLDVDIGSILKVWSNSEQRESATRFAFSGFFSTSVILPEGRVVTYRRLLSLAKKGNFKGRSQCINPIKFAPLLIPESTIRFVYTLQPMGAT